MTLQTKRWEEPRTEGDGYRVLICRYRPRGVSRDRETWDAWLPHLGPSVELHSAVYGKRGAPIGWEEYAARYTEEMSAHSFWIRGFAEQVARGGPLTLLCSTACVDPARCHRTLLRALILAMNEPADRAAPRVARRAKRE